MKQAVERTIQVVVFTLLLGFFLLFFNGWRFSNSQNQNVIQVLRVDEEFENHASGFKQKKTKNNDHPDARYRTDVLRRIEGFREEHTKNGRPEVVGLRGISWLYTNLNGMLLAAPELEKMFEERKVVGGKLNIEIRDVSGNPCDAARANLVSIYTRIAGPEVMSALAEPVPGKCKWIARYEVTIPGAYTILARLLHYNGMQDWGDECQPVESKSELEQTYVEVLHDIPRYPFYFTTVFDCCTMCSRFRDCRYSLQGDEIWDKTRWGDGKQCLLFKKSSSDNPRAIRGDQISAKFNNSGEHVLRYTGSRLGEYPLGTIWQLACGRDQLLLRWAPCGSYGAPVGSSMRGTEDIILFEHEHRDLLIDPSVDMPEWSTTLEEAQEEFDAPIGHKDFKPVCDWSKLRITDFEKGRWTRSPFARYQSCDPFKTFYASPFQASPKYPEVDDPICTLRYDLQNLNSEDLRNPPKEMSYKSIWRTELSDSYLIRNQALFNSPFVPGPWVGYYRLHPSSPCRMPPLRSAKQIRQCFIDRNFTTLTLNGDSIVWYLEQHLNTLFPAAFPNKDEFKYVRNPSSMTDMLFQWANYNASRAFLANAAAAHLLYQKDMNTNIQILDGLTGFLGKDYNIKIWNTPPFMLWERQPYLTAERTLYFREIMRERFDKHGWYEVDFTALSAAWTIDSTIERDSLHVIGHAMVTFVQLLVDIICRAPFS